MITMYVNMCDQEVLLSWDGHHKTMITVFQKLLENNNLVNCTLAIEGKLLKVHKEVLSAFSPFFQLLFEEETENNPTIVLGGFTYQDLSALIHYMYNGRVQLCEENVNSFLDAAQSLQIRGLGDDQEKVNLENWDEYSNSNASSVSTPFTPSKRRKIRNRKGMALVWSADPADAGMKWISLKEAQELQSSINNELKQNEDEAGGCSTLNMPSSVKSDTTMSNVALSPVKQHETPLSTRSAVVSAKSVIRSNPFTDKETSVQDEFTPKRKEKENEDGNLYENNRNSYKNPSCCKNLLNASSSGIEQSGDKDISSPEDTSLPLPVPDDLLTSELMLKTESFSQDENVIEEVSEESEHSATLGEMETENLNANSSQIPGGSFEIKEELLSGIQPAASNSSTTDSQRPTIGVAESGAKETSGRIAHIQGHPSSAGYFKCSPYQYVTALPSQLERHRDTRIGGMPFRSPQCDCVTGNSSLLAQHRHMHTGGNPFKYSERSIIPGNHGNFYNYKRFYAGEKRLKCPLCSTSFAKPSGLKQHLVRYHGADLQCSIVYGPCCQTNIA